MPLKYWIPVQTFCYNRAKKRQESISLFCTEIAGNFQVPDLHPQQLPDQRAPIKVEVTELFYYIRLPHNPI